MADFFARLKQRKLVQWSLAYIAAAFALIQVIDVVADSYDWPHLVMHLIFGVLTLGFIVTLVLAWYHGEHGVQHVSGPELLLIALALAIGGGLLWHFGRAGSPSAPIEVAARASTTTMAAVSSTSSAPPASAVADATPIAAQPIPAKSIAVLPFANLSSNKDNAYFVAGMQDLILTKLADIGDLKVISRTSTEKYRSHPDDLKTIGRQLGVATILEGSVQKAGDEVLINVQLIDTRTDSHVWAQSYTRTLDNIFGVEGEVAGKVADALKAKLGPVATKALAAVPTSNPAAYDLFLRADYLVRRAALSYDTDALKLAIPLYRQALTQDPTFALARARLSMVESRLAYLGGGEDVAQLEGDARAQAKRALGLNPELPEAHLALGMSDYYGRLDYAAALDAVAKALALRPNDAGALFDRGSVLRRMGRFDDAIASQQRAVELNPRDASMVTELANTYMLLSRYLDADRLYRRALALNPENVTARHSYTYATLFRTGDVERALAVAASDDPQLQQLRARLLTLQRKYAAALVLLGQIPADKYGVWGGIKALRQANLYRLLGDAARATPLFERALPEVRAQLARQTSPRQQISGWSRIASVELGLGQTDAGLAAIAKSLAIAKRTRDFVLGSGWIVSNAKLYAEAGKARLAVSLLAKALTSPGIGLNYSPVMLWLDPAWDPIRHDPRFQALLKQHAKYKPEVIPAPPAPATSNAPSAAVATGSGHD